MLVWRMDHLDATNATGRDETLSGAKATLSTNKRAKIGRVRMDSIDKGGNLSQSTVSGIDTAGTGGVGGGESMEKVGELVAETIQVGWPGQGEGSTSQKKDNARKEIGRLDERGERMDDVGIVPLPAKDDLFPRLEIAKSKETKGKGRRVWVETGAYDSVGPATTASKAGITAADTSIESHVEGRTNEMDKRFRHTEMSISIERIEEID